MKSGYVFINDNVFETLLATSSEEQEVGLMYRDPPVPNMTFTYSSPKISKFWMKNTKAPLDIIFCSKGKIIDICYGEPFSTKMIGPNIASDLVVELPYGTVVKNNIRIGQTAGLLSENLLK